MTKRRRHVSCQSGTKAGRFCAKLTVLAIFLLKGKRGLWGLTLPQLPAVALSKLSGLAHGRPVQGAHL